MNSLTRHKYTTQNKEPNDRMKLKDCALSQGSKRQIIQNPTLRDPISHQSRNRQRSRDGGAFEVLAFARCVFGDIGNGDIEACQAGETAEDEEG